MGQRDPAKLFPHDYLMRPVVRMLPDWVTPNHLTIFRMLMTPIVLWFLFEEMYSVGVPLFIFSAFTDALDGSMARLRNQITPWGTFHDPVADKFLIGSVILLIVIQHVNAYLALALIVVELMLIGGGWYKRQHGKISSANIWGKVKMILQVFGVSFLLIALWLGIDLFVDISNGTFALALVFAVVSLLTYSL
jgi:CDP-diacylglycerol--glycerol-3-phosphate 3-phosphatidyltransferase